MIQASHDLDPNVLVHCQSCDWEGAMYALIKELERNPCECGMLHCSVTKNYIRCHSRKLFIGPHPESPADD